MGYFLVDLLDSPSKWLWPQLFPNEFLHANCIFLEILYCLYACLLLK